MAPSADSAAAVSDAAATDAASAPLLSQPIPFVMLSDDSTFEIAPEAIAYLKQIKGTVAVVAIAGLYRTGKSYMLNLLLGRDRAEAMFNVGATVNACTKGIWIWGQPVQLSAVADLATDNAFKHLPKDTTIVFMDTEGLGSVQRSQTQDTRIFALALLLSSLFIYNSRGVIDSSAIEDLSLVVHLTKFIQAKAHAPSQLDGNGDNDDDNDNNELAAFFPDFLWVVRDFTLRLQEDGRTVTPREYFESALKHQAPVTDEVVQKNRIRSLLATFFPTRDCVTMVRPLNDERLLRELIHQPYESLRPEFRAQMAVLKTKVFGALKPKRVLARTLNGAMLVALAQNYVDAFNSGASPVIATVWDRVLESQCDEALESAKAAFTRHFDAAMAAAADSVEVNHQLLPLPLDDATLNELYEQARAVAEHELEHEDLSATASMAASLEQLSEFMLAALRDAFDKAERDSVAYNRALLAELSTSSAALHASDSDSNSVQQLQTALTESHAKVDDVVAVYRERARGVAASSVLNDFVAASLVDGLADWGANVKTAFRTQAAALESDVSALKQTLRAVESKVRAADELLAQQRESYDRALRSIAERTESERSGLEEAIAAQQTAIERAQLELEQLTAVHTDALALLDAQLAAARAERQRLEDDVRASQAQRDSERKAAMRQLLESERSFHREETELLQHQHELLQRIIALEQELGDLDAQETLESLRREQATAQHEAELTRQYEHERDELKQRSVESIQALKSEQDSAFAALRAERNDQRALLSALREQLETRQAIVETKRAKAMCVHHTHGVASPTFVSPPPAAHTVKRRAIFVAPMNVRH